MIDLPQKTLKKACLTFPVYDYFISPSPSSPFRHDDDDDHVCRRRERGVGGCERAQTAANYAHVLYG